MVDLELGAASQHAHASQVLVADADCALRHVLARAHGEGLIDDVVRGEHERNVLAILDAVLAHVCLVHAQLLGRIPAFAYLHRQHHPATCSCRERHTESPIRLDLRSRQAQAIESVVPDEPGRLRMRLGANSTAGRRVQAQREGPDTRSAPVVNGLANAGHRRIRRHPAWYATRSRAAHCWTPQVRRHDRAFGHRWSGAWDGSGDGDAIGRSSGHGLAIR
mmetsp:Transcript_3881/g.11203  ORF Transcript_3881/g.11203 Transcript_3881/m.11203 type:complete len:220 (+) Transcript_3881:543-1202(+)